MWLASHDCVTTRQLNGFSNEKDPGTVILGRCLLRTAWISMALAQARKSAECHVHGGRVTVELRQGPHTSSRGPRSPTSPTPKNRQETRDAWCGTHRRPGGCCLHETAGEVRGAGFVAYFPAGCLEAALDASTGQLLIYLHLAMQAVCSLASPVHVVCQSVIIRRG